MAERKHYHYFVEGENEKSVIKVLKTELQCIVPGRVEVFNSVQNLFSVDRLRLLRKGTVAVLVFDTDRGDSSILRKNILFMQKQAMIGDVLCIPQVKNLEEELIYSCKIKCVKELTKSATRKDFKRDLQTCSNLGIRLRECEFSLEKFWSRLPQNDFRDFPNDAEKIKLTKG